MALNWVTATHESAYDMSEVAPRFGVKLVGVEQFLRAKLSVAAPQAAATSGRGVSA